jgi:ubiquinone/menaquinone biosynthesis C-methylase UbiE
VIQEIVHFFRIAPPVIKLQKEMSQAQFFDWISNRVDEEGFTATRRALVGDLEGKVLEVGGGTGAMFAHYGAGAKVEAIEPEASFLELAKEKAARSGGRVRALAGDGMNLEFPDASFDAVVFGMVLCSVPSMERVLAEARRVLRPGGKLRALEHVRSPRAIAGLAMDLVNPLWLKLNKQGCNLNRRPRQAIEAAGFTVDSTNESQDYYQTMPAFLLQRIAAHR